MPLLQKNEHTDQPSTLAKVFGQTGHKTEHNPPINANGNHEPYHNANTFAPQFQGTGATNGTNGAHYGDVPPALDEYHHAQTTFFISASNNFDSSPGMSQPNAAGVGAHGRGLHQPPAGFEAGGKGGNMNQTGAGAPTGNLHTNPEAYRDSRYPNPASVAPPQNNGGYEQNRNLGQSHIPQDHGNLNTSATAGIPPAAHDGRPTTYGTAGAGGHVPRDATGYGAAINQPPPNYPMAAGGYPNYNATQSGRNSSPSSQILIGKVEKVVGSLICSEEMKNEGADREAEGKRMAHEHHAGRLDHEASMARDRAAQHGEYAGHAQQFAAQPGERRA